ncbi:hypothetical protein ACXX8U_14165, partial [Flavobacterium sp. GNP001]
SFMMIKTEPMLQLDFGGCCDQLVMKKLNVQTGGLQQAENMGFPTNDKTETPKLVPNDPQLKNHQLQQLPKWKTILRTKIIRLSMFEKTVGIAASMSHRFSGRSYSWAINIPFMTNLNQNGRFLSASELKTKISRNFWSY